ncbi:MAG: hypothetical protein HZB42_05255 [Sphingobacteriales bacterium]|nr:hypothetical protein [Sphingobacteriales bacterium]
MQKKHAIKRNGGFLKFVFLFLLPVTLLIASCDKSQKSLSLSTVTLTKKQVKAWIDNGMIKPGDSAGKRYLLLQFYTGDAKSGSNMQLVAFPASSFTNVNLKGKTILEVDRAVNAQTFSGPAMMASSLVCLEEIGIMNPDGSLGDFESVNFSPYVNTEGYVAYQMEVKNTKGLIDTTKSPWPCPPYCCPGPCCPINDTIQNF